MALTAVKFELVNKSLANKEIDFDSDTIKCALLSAYTPDASATGHQYWSQVKAAGTEAVGTGYTAGGVTLTSVTWTQTGGVWALKGTIPAWNTTGGSLAAAYAVSYDGTPATDATRPVICYWNLDGAGGTQTSSNGTFTLTQNASGIFTLD
jgi:hypothetical protein